MIKAIIGDIVRYSNRKWLWFTTFRNGKAFLVLEQGEISLKKGGKEITSITTSIKNLILQTS